MFFFFLGKLRSNEKVREPRRASGETENSNCKFSNAIYEQASASAKKQNVQYKVIASTHALEMRTQVHIVV